jgi:hypothetical protein
MVNDRFLALFAKELSGEAAAEELEELRGLTDINAELCYLSDVFWSLWNQGTAVDQAEISAAWEPQKRRCF